MKSIGKYFGFECYLHEDGRMYAQVGDDWGLFVGDDAEIITWPARETLPAYVLDCIYDYGRERFGEIRFLLFIKREP